MKNHQVSLHLPHSERRYHVVDVMHIKSICYDSCPHISNTHPEVLVTDMESVIVMVLQVMNQNQKVLYSRSQLI